MCSAAAAQSSNSSAQAAPQNQNQQQQSDSSQRVFGVVPQFLVTSDSNPAPLTSRQKFKLFEKTSLDPFTFVSSGFQAALSQASDEFPQYGQGASGYAKRYGATFADQVSSNFFANFLYPVLLKEDPRYFRLGRGSVKRRIMYSLTQEFVARRDNGARTFAFENVLGAFTSGTVSNAYYPSNDRGVRLTVSRSVIAMLYGSVGGIFSEFSPDIQRKLFQRKSKQRTSPERNPYASGSSVRQCHP
ncbi:MAG: hypothetical protein JO065_03050 [Acidobacteria bacterium]|nr:hypothetical protein [Acidobacteriota bacterium]MBV9436231.1 hypothetical protein [Acidobacteriota bacterium]